MPEKRKRYQLTLDERHSHSVLLGNEGNGTSTENSGHRHEIREWEVITAGEVPHSHTILGK